MNDLKIKLEQDDQRAGCRANDGHECPAMGKMAKTGGNAGFFDDKILSARIALIQSDDKKSAPTAGLLQAARKKTPIAKGRGQWKVSELTNS